MTENHDERPDYLIKELEHYKERYRSNEYKKFKIDLLVRLAKRTADFSKECKDCQNFHEEIKKQSKHFKNIATLSAMDLNSHQSLLNTISHHLKKDHKLITEGENVGTWLAIGMPIGLTFGTIFNDIAIGISMGLAVGIAIGSGLDEKAKKDGKVI